MSGDPKQPKVSESPLPQQEGPREDRSNTSYSNSSAYVPTLGIGAVCLFISLIALVVFNQSAPTKSAQPTIEALQKEIDAYEPPNSWRYRRQADKLRGGFTDLACKRSEQKVILEPPYEPIYAEICLRINPDKTKDIYVNLLGDGQIVCYGLDGCKVPVKIGSSAAPKVYLGLEPSDGSTGILFVTPSSKLFDALKRGTISVFEIEFYQAGLQQLEFNTASIEPGRL